MTKSERPASATKRIELSIEQQIIALEHEMDAERLRLSLVPDSLQALRAELAAVERMLNRKYSYFFPLTRKRLNVQAGDLHRRIALQTLELEELRALHPESESNGD